MGSSSSNADRSSERSLGSMVSSWPVCCLLRLRRPKHPYEHAYGPEKRESGLMHSKFLGVLLACAWVCLVGQSQSDAQSCIPEERYNPAWVDSSHLDYGLEDDLLLEENNPGYFFRYCKSGNRLDRFETFPPNWLVQLHYSILLTWTPRADDLFLWYEDEHIPWPDCADFDDYYNVFTLNGRVSFWVSPHFVPRQYYLHRPSPFSAPTLYDLTTSAQLTASASKIIVLVHGWNPYKVIDAFDDSPWCQLTESILAKLSTEEFLGWSLVQYHWEQDAQTGFIFDLNNGSNPFGRQNGTEAAEIAHQHGQHLGELLECKNGGSLQKVHFVAHSAGTWVARTAAKWLLESTSDTVVQLTLLDPYMPLSRHEMTRGYHPFPTNRAANWGNG